MALLSRLAIQLSYIETLSSLCTQNTLQLHHAHQLLIRLFRETRITYTVGNIHSVFMHKRVVQGGSNMTGTDLYVNKPHCAAAVRLIYIQISPGHI